MTARMPALLVAPTLFRRNENTMRMASVGRSRKAADGLHRSICLCAAICTMRPGLRLHVLSSANERGFPRRRFDRVEVAIICRRLRKLKNHLIGCRAAINLRAMHSIGLCPNYCITQPPAGLTESESYFPWNADKVFLLVTMRGLNPIPANCSSFYRCALDELCGAAVRFLLLMRAIWRVSTTPAACIAIAKVEPKRPVGFQNATDLAEYIHHLSDECSRAVFKPNLSRAPIITQAKVGWR